MSARCMIHLWLGKTTKAGSLKMHDNFKPDILGPQAGIAWSGSKDHSCKLSQMRLVRNHCS